MSFEESLVKNEQRSEKMDPAGQRGLGLYPQWEVKERRAACLHLEIASVRSPVMDSQARSTEAAQESASNSGEKRQK